MLKYYDVICDKCEYIEERFLETDKNLKPCVKCGGKTNRVWNRMSFKLIYNNQKDMCGWGNSGYATSQYHRETKG